MRVVLSPRSQKQLRKLAKIDQIAVAKKIRELSSFPVRGEKKLLNTKAYRVRVGNLRVVYLKEKSLIYIVLIGHRGDIYKLLKQLF